MRVMLATYGSRGDVEPLVALAVRALGTEVRVCAPPDEEFAMLLADVGVPLVPFGRPWRSWVRPAAAQERTRCVAEYIVAQYDTVAAAAERCEVLLATGMSHFVARSVAKKRAIPHRYVTFAPGMLTDPDAQSWNALFGPPINSHRASIGLSPVDDVRAFLFTDHPWLVADPTRAPWQETVDLDVVHTGAWILPDERLLPTELVAFLDAGTPPVYVGLGSMRGVPGDFARVAIEVIRAQGRAARLHRVRDHLRRDMAVGGLPGLLVHLRASLPRLANREPARRDRRGRAGAGRRPGHGRPTDGRPSRGRRGNG
jgi:vancomycin aglycone glucosyltransferase